VKQLRLFIEEKGIDVPRGSNLKLKRQIVDFIWNWQCESERIDGDEGVSEPGESVVVAEENEHPRREDAESLATDTSKQKADEPNPKPSLSQSINQREFVASTTANTPGYPIDSDYRHVDGGDGNDDDDYDDGPLLSVGRPKAGPSLSDLEDLEEERLAVLEEEAELQRRKSAQLSTTPSNLYADVYSAASSQASEQRERPIPDDSNPLGRTTQQEIDLAKKRDKLQNTRLNEMFEEEDAKNAARQAKIHEMMEEDDKRWKEERRKRLMGKYAGKTLEEVEEMIDEDRKKSEHELELKVNLAKQAGVTLTMLEPTDTEDSPAEEGSTFKPAIDSGRRESWFSKDESLDLQSELQALQSKDASSSIEDKLSGEDGPRFVDGKLMNREQLMGISVGSAGGWSLEVFPGDFVVHRRYGIGRYDKTVLKPKSKLTEEEREASEARRKEIINELMASGKQLHEIQAVVEKFGTEEDLDPISNPLSTLLEVAYGDAVVHVPIERAYRMSRYRAGDAAIKPRLSRVKGEAWSKAKRKVEASTVQMAEDVLALYATRETLNRAPFDPSVEGRVHKFAESFPFEPTPDQRKCFEDVENDMVWRSRPMDRLICGDVGFGKTEVAMRALFRAVANGRQAAMLAPTGVLAAQHYKSIVKRMGDGTDHGFNVALLRGGMGKNTKKGRELRAAIAAGEVDVVIGTHALLSNGMSFKDLGLLTIDEEQRFGVNQKERLKLICNNVDVLTLTATPIPRTLQMSLSGIRDTSTIRSPPPMRKPTISYVSEFDAALVRDAIEREMTRGGQCYYVVPRISQLKEAEKLLKQIFPELRIVQAHGRMPRGKAEENVADFAEGNHDVLLATTVIENGVDIPQTNTIIIQNAQAFGMSTLYQLRGRVGRSDLQAYAYFFHKNDFITEQSAQRLQAMADLHELGSGFDVANRDLEIRGAGSLLGTEQSGMAARVGFDLYMRMLKKSMRQLRGLDLPMVPRSNVLLPDGEGSIEWSAEGTGGGENSGGSNGSYIIPKSYIEDDDERSREEGAARLAESTQRLVEVTGSWKEKYGNLPSELQGNLKSLHLHACLRQLGVDVVGLDESTGDCVLRSPGLRPRHWAMICSQLSRKSPPAGLDVVFPARFSGSDDDTEVRGGTKLDLKELLSDPRYSDDDEEWDALDEEEVEAMKEISSAVDARSLADVDVYDFPRFVIRGMRDKIKSGSRVDALLKVLLPPSKVVFKKQQKDKEKARVAAELREKREIMSKQKKEQEKIQSRRTMYSGM